MTTESIQGTAPKKIKADATKDFFVKMITRDISLRDCIFDLLDNAIDGARRKPAEDREFPLRGYKIELEFDAERFSIQDNCGGILLSDAIDYAFHFGRRPDSPTDVKGGIGLYGIGMKRAIFKIGRSCEVFSEAADAAFKVKIDVDEWESRADWNFSYDDIAPTGQLGTRIEIVSLNSGIAGSLGDPGFKNELMKAIARDYAFFIQQGIAISVGEDPIPSYKYQLTESASVAPAVETFEDDGVQVRILAGLVDKIPDDVPDDLRPEMVDRYGWFVVCNDRVVLAADKTERTVWGDDGFNIWHGQYNGFAGFVFFHSEDQRKLPWTTTKRELDAQSPLYKRTVERMKVVSKAFIDYTNRRKLDLDAAHREEGAEKKSIDISEFRAPQLLKLPKISEVAVRPDYVTISYRKSKKDVEEIRRHLGRIGMSAKDVGLLTFDFYMQVELGK